MNSYVPLIRYHIGFHEPFFISYLYKNAICTALFTYTCGNCKLKVNNRNTRTWCEKFSKLTIKTPVLLSLMLILNIFHTLL